MDEPSGTSLCSRCQAENPPVAKFCRRCGASLAEDAPPQVENVAAGAAEAMPAPDDGQLPAGGNAFETRARARARRPSLLVRPVAGLVVVLGVGYVAYQHWHAQVSWTSQSLSASNTLQSIQCSIGGTCLTTGQNGTILTSTNGGVTWPVSGLINIGGTSTTLSYGDSVSSVACPSTGECYAVGYYAAFHNNGSGAEAILLHNSNVGSSWTVVGLGASVRLSSIACMTDSDCVAVGPGGTIMTIGNYGLTPLTVSSGTSSNLNGVACPSASSCVAVGDGGTILVSTDSGGTWSSESSATTNGLHGIACPASNSCLAVGDNGTIVSSSDSGLTWTVRSSGTGDMLHSLSCASADVCLAVGDNGAVVETHDGGATWSGQNSGTGNDLYDVSCPMLAECVAVGANGTILTKQ
jgi:photosystem II stability/assembly factor-like uncharacterized protein